MGASSLIDSIKETVLGVKSNETDRIIDKSLETISLYSSNSDNNKYIEALKNIVAATNSGKDNTFLGQLDRGMPQVQTYDQSGRVARYAEYDAVCNKISYAQRALQVLTDHIIAPDDILKYSLQIVPYDRNIEDKKVDIAKTRLREIFRHFKFEKKVKDLVKDTLKYGDKFIEIVPVPKGKNALVVINEGIDYNAFRTPTSLTETKETLTITENKFNFETQKQEEIKSSKDIKIIVDECKIEEIKDNKVVLTEELVTTVGLGGTLSGLGVNMMTPMGALPQSSSGFPKAMSKDDHVAKSTDPEDKKFKSKYSDDVTDEEEVIEGSERLDLKDITLVFHDPKYVIRLETERFKVCLGYLVFPKVDPTTMLGNGINTNIDAICSSFLDDIQKKLNLNSDKIAVNDDIKKVLLGHLMRIKKNDDLKIRYVAPQYMQHFRINVSRYAPYGESLFDSSLYDCKLLMALKTAATIKKINASSDKRFVSVEVGLPRDAKNIVQRMEEFLTKKRMSIGSIGNIDSIPSQISTFETIFIPMKDNKKFVEIDHQNWGGDTSNDTDNIKNMRDGIVGNWGVPAPFLNIEENCLPYNTQIRLLNGDSLPIGRIVDLWESNEKNRNIWVYSCDPETGKIKPGKVTNVFRTRKNAQLVRVHLDNGTYVDATPDHKFMLRDGSYLEAQYLKQNDSLMPLYIRDTKIKTRIGTAYEEVYDPCSGKWRLVYRLVSEELNRVVPNSKLHVHHIDRNPKNNHPDNLLVCTQHEHCKIHGYLNNKDNVGNVLYENHNTRLLELRKCIICGEEFEAPVQCNWVTCGKESCKKERARIDGYKSWEKSLKKNPDLSRISLKCTICGKDINIIPSTIKKAHKDNNGNPLVACSKECRAILAGLIKTMNYKKSIHERVEPCVVCGTPCIVDDKHNRTHTCSVKCQNIVLNKRRWNGYNKKRTFVKCFACGKPIEVETYRLKDQKNFACDDPKCKGAVRSYASWQKRNPDKTMKDYAQMRGIIPYEYKNHKVVSIEWLTDKQDCYDIEVEKYHNFGLTNGIIVHNSSNRSSLTTESINFVRIVISYQKELSDPLHELSYKVYSLIYGKQEADILDKIQITFAEPKALPNSAQAEYIETMQRVIDALAALGISRDYLKKEYLPNIDWDKVAKSTTSEKLDAEVGDSNNNMDMMLGGAGMGGTPMMGGMPGGF